MSVCPTCGCTPCPSPGFCRLCREADRKQAAKHDFGLPPDWHEMSIVALWTQLNHPSRRATPQATIEAVMVAVRARGVAALKEPANVARLRRCDDAAKAEINRRIAMLQTRAAA